LDVVPVGVAVHCSQAFASGVDEPQVSGEQVGFIDGPVRPTCDRFGVVGECAPEIGDELVPVVDGLGAGLVPCGAFEEHGERSGERLDVVVDVAERRPDLRCDATLAAEPGERRLHLSDPRVLEGGGDELVAGVLEGPACVEAGLVRPGDLAAGGVAVPSGEA